ncbi:bifunctional DNA primase/polymerase [Primorskyibacter sp. S87]|uniref:bifunctional DNA primase/polymerase n=1 Tax=Primorskyibacter sp. S87 TaxID=3415126 RepID=UPI003C7EB5E9
MSQRWNSDSIGLKDAVTFPVKVFRSDERWQKIPLVGEWQKLTASVPDGDPAWARANGVGILMGRGLYALDLDSYKSGSAPEQWLKRHELTGDTRVHRTVSGGLHAIYRVPAKFGDLPTRSGIVAGLDGRGTVGFIAFGEGYSVVRAKAPATMTDSACREILDRYSGGSRRRRLDLPEPNELTPEHKADVMERLEVKILVGARIACRWKGMTGSLKEPARSRSAMDYSMAHMLARAGFSFDEIVFLLIEKFEHGQAANRPHVRQPRAARRCAADAIRALEPGYTEPKFVEPRDLSDEEEAKLLSVIRRHKGC